MNSVEEIFKIKINDNSLFVKALTHPSYTQEKEMSYCDCYERLEFLGDAVLKLSISDVLYKMFPDYAEGKMSQIRSIIVSDHTLSNISREIGLSKLIIAGTHEVKNGIKNLESVTACAFEAVLGAYYLDGKFDELLKFIEETFIPYINDVNNNLEKYNAKALLQEYTQSLTKETPVYTLVSESGPDHKKTFTVDVSYKNEVIARGEGKTKKDAEQKAAYEACKMLGVVKCQK